MSYSIPVNMTKYNSKNFFVLIGPGINVTYTQADQVDPNMSFVKGSQKMSGGTITEVMSNDDAAMMAANGNNMMSSGNTNRFYDAAYEHNMRNLLQLQKQYTEVELLGLNLAIMRGEKIPMMILDYDKVMGAARINNFTGAAVQSMLYEIACGWYIIDGLMWEWSPDNSETGQTLWRTKLKLTRREWPVSGNPPLFGTTDNETVQEVEIGGGGNTAGDVEGLNGPKNYASDGGNFSDMEDTGVDKNDANTTGYSNTNASQELKVDESDKAASASEVPLTGLKEEMKLIYRAIKNVCPKIKIVSARRWAVNAEGLRVDGNAFLQKNGLYKCANAKGEIMYFKDKASRHLYGEAFDIINDSGQDFNSIMTDYILVNPNILELMAKNGVSACIEQTTDDSGAATKHYHIGTDQSISNAFWSSVQAYNTNLPQSLLMTIKAIGQNRENFSSNEILNTEIDENQLEENSK